MDYTLGGGVPITTLVTKASPFIKIQLTPLDLTFMSVAAILEFTSCQNACSKEQ